MSTHRNDKESKTLDLEPARFVDSPALTIAGLKAQFKPEDRKDMPKLWARFSKHLGKVPAQVGNVAYGLCWCPNTGGFEYLAGMEVSATDSLPADFQVVTIPPQRYAGFSHVGHVSKLHETLDAIHENWLPQAGEEMALSADGAPNFFERYGPKFDPQKGTGDIEVWIPIKKAERVKIQIPR